MVRVVEILTSGELRVGGEELIVPATGPSSDRALCWIDVIDQDASLMAKLGATYKLHPLAIEDCLHFDQRPKIEEYPGHLFLVLHGFTCETKDPTDVSIHELHAFLLEKVVITVHSGVIPALDTVYARAKVDPLFLARGVDLLLHSVCDEVVDANFPILDLLSDALDEVEERVLSRLSRTDLTQIFKLKKTLVTMRRTLSPQRDVFALLAKRGDVRISERATVYFRDVYDHLARIYEQIDTGRDLLGNALDAYLSSVSNRTNEIMKRLTIMSAIFLPMGFIVGFFGQNFAVLSADGLVWVMAVLLALIPIGMIFWFYRWGWIGDR